MKSNFQRRSRNGFALIVVLSFVVLLVILTLGLLSLSAIELRRSGRISESSEARANARLALMLAIGELQRELGPDQRITAPGGQQMTEGATGAGKNWTGVYDAWPSTSVARPEPTFRRWLISGDEPVVKTRNAATGGTTLAAATIPLSRADSQNEAIRAGVITTDGGGYAWWVSDNQTKAKIGDPMKKSETTEEAIAALQSSPRFAHEPFIGDTVTPSDPRLARLLSVSTVDLLAKHANPLLHDATTISSGLVTNVRNGGFRKDLNFLLEKPYNDVARTVLYKAGGTNGMRLDELWAYQNIWGELQNSGALAHADGSTLPSGTPYLQPPADKAAAYDDPFRKYRQLTRVQLTVVYSLISRQNPVDPTKYDLYLAFDPITTIWNPFNVSVSIPTDAYTTIQSWHPPYQLNVEVVPPGSAPPTNWKANLYSITGATNQTRVGKVQKVVLRPGEVQVLSQSGSDAIRKGNETDVRLGWNFGSGFAYPLYRTSKDASGTSKNETPPLGPFPANSQVRFFLVPGDNGNISHGLGANHSRQYIGDESDPNALSDFGIGNFSIDWTTVVSGTRNGNLVPNQHPAIFRSVPKDSSYSKMLSEILVPEGANANNKMPMFVYTIGFRTEDDPLYPEIAQLPSQLSAAGSPTGSNQPPVRYTARSVWGVNPKSFAYDLGNLSPDWTRETPIQVGMRRITSLGEVIDSTSSGVGYFGASHTVDGNSYVVTQSIPQAPVQSLGMLQNSLADGLPDNATVRGAGSNFQRVWYLRPSISHAIANSFAPPIMGPSQTETTRGDGKYKHDLADHSYLVNRALWDDYFYSSITPRTTTAHKDSSTAYNEQKTRLANLLGTAATPSIPLPNPRMKAWQDNPAAVLSEIFQGSTPAADAAERIGAHLMIDGAFNVNSTSVTAWKSFLSGLKGMPVPTRNAASPSQNPSLTTTDEVAATGLLVAAGGKISPSGLNSSISPDQWLGFRTLTDDQIDELSKAIVRQVRLRGPFLSLSDFINRRPGDNKDLAVSGALQSALDDGDVTINKEFREGTRALSVSDASSQGFDFPEAAAGAKSAGSPGYVKQGDLLTSLAPMITVRGDTFTIRTYGESRSKSGEVTARAYCEAVVQRIPGYLDPVDEARINPPVSQVNKKFGRRFEIVSFRYLNPTEI